LTLEAWKTIIYHYYNLDDQLGFSLNTLTMAVRLFGSATDSTVRQGNTTGVHLQTQAFVKRNKNGKKLGMDRFRLLLLTDPTAEPKESADISGWKHEHKNSKAVIDKTSPLFVGIQAIPSFKDRAVLPCASAGLKISQLRKKVIAPNVTEDAPSQGDATVATPPIPPSYWDNPKARGLFQPQPEDPVQECFQRRVDLGEETVSRLTDHQKQRLVHIKCLYSRVAYEKALFGMGSGLVSWTKCTESAVEETNRFGLTTFSRPRTVADMNQDFRSMEVLGVAHGVLKGFQGSELLQIFPCC
jgi:hypothetical protein